MAQTSVCGLTLSIMAFKDFTKWIGEKVFRNTIFGPIGSFFGNIDDIAKFARGEGTGSSDVDSFMNTITQAGPTGRDQWIAQREDTLNQRAVADMQAAGLNAALMYGSSGNQASINTSSSGQSSGLSDLLQLAMLPLQMRQAEADIKNTEADTKNTEQRTRTEEQNTLVQGLIAQWYPSITEAKVAVDWANVDKAYSDIYVNESKKDLIDSQEAVQEIIAEYLPSKYEAEINELGARAEKLEADKALDIVRRDFEDIQYKFARKNGFLMSSSDSLLLVTYIASLLGLDKDSVSDFIQNDLPKVVKKVNEDSHLGTPGGPHK